MKAKKLPSGSWRVRVYSHTDARGIKHYESFTAASKAQAEMMAAEFAANKKRKQRHDLTVPEAVSGYIDAKAGVLSPSTVRGYRGMMHYYDTLARKRIESVTSEELQRFVSDLAVKVSPKTVRNIYTLLSSSLALYLPDAVYRVTLPARQVKRLSAPSDEDIKMLYDSASDKMKLCIILGMRGLRRGEICALRYEDIVDGVAHIHADMVKGPDGWVYKEIPKTQDSDRYVRVPELGSGEGYVVGLLPDTITHRFTELRDKCGLSIRFHDLRHYFASIAAVLNIPDVYTADMGGWRRGGKSVMKSVYQNNIKSMSDYYEAKVASYLDDILKDAE